ncbi:MAG: SEC-C domain-containing protein [Acidobacteriia bacterium]|nr:SEC-C domain-containing protein [Terriglobia bacterium]
MKDFVYDPVEVPKGDSTREVSDGMLIVGDRGLILQVKSRDPSADRDSAKVSRWAMKKASEAVRQVQGTRRTLETTKVTLRSRRGHELVLEPPQTWAGVVLLDLDPVPDGLRICSDDDDTIIMTLADWHELHYMILSTSGVIDYVERVVEQGIENDLGHEWDRYRRFAEADSISANKPGYEPVLPLNPLSDNDRICANVLDEWIDSDIAATPVDNGRYTADQVRSAVETLDSIPILLRVQIGEAMLSRVRDSVRSGEPRSTLLTIDSPARLLFFTDVSGNWNNKWRYLEPHLTTYTAVRHEQLEEHYGPGETLLLARVERDDGSVWRTFVRIAGSAKALSLPPDVRWGICAQFGILTAEGICDLASISGVEKCPCGAGGEFRDCHGPDR